MVKRGKCLLVLVLGLLMVMGTVVHAGQEINKKELEAKLSKIFGPVKVLGAIPSTRIPGMTEVVVQGSRGQQAVLFLAPDAEHFILGRYMDIETGQDQTKDLAYEKGVLPLPKGKEVKAAKISEIKFKDSPTFGNPKGVPVTVFFCPLCPYCIKTLKSLKPYADKGEILLRLKYFNVHGERGEKAEVEAECIRRNEKDPTAYWNYLFNDPHINFPKSQNCKQKEAIEKMLDRDREDGKKLGIRAVPTLIIGKELFTGAPNEVALKRIIDKKSNKK